MCLRVGRVARYPTKKWHHHHGVMGDEPPLPAPIACVSYVFIFLMSPHQRRCAPLLYHCQNQLFFRFPCCSFSCLPKPSRPRLEPVRSRKLPTSVPGKSLLSLNRLCSINSDFITFSGLYRYRCISNVEPYVHVMYPRMSPSSRGLAERCW